MNIVFLISVFLKGIGALLEILLQIMITRQIGLSGYGTYTTWINSADLIFWCLFSGIVKCNTFYLSGEKAGLKRFRFRYYTWFVLPVICVISIFAGLAGKYTFWIISLIALSEVLVMDRSSCLLAEGRYVQSLTGEYVFGRLVLVISLALLQNMGKPDLSQIILLYLLQYLLVLAFFMCIGKKHTVVDYSDKVSLKKWFQYQRADIMQAMIGQMPVILQYLFVGAFEAGITGIVLMVKKLINFVSGPASKIFLPEFSRLYRRNQKEEIRKCFASVMRIQMLFVGPLAVVLIGYPHVILGILAKELISRTFLFSCCSMIFLLAATLGPCGGLLQMSENEKMDNRCRETAIAAMFLTFFILRKNPLFALYGLCVQTLLESVSKYIYVCKWLKSSPVSLNSYLIWWMIPMVGIAATYILKWQNSSLMMIVTAGVVFLTSLYRELKQEENLKNIITVKRKKHESKNIYD